MRETSLLHKWDKWGPDWSGQGNEACTRQKHIRCLHSSSQAKGLTEWKSRVCGTHLLLQQGHTSCSGLWKCFTRLLAASLMSSCTSTDRIPDKRKDNHTQLKTHTKEGTLTNPRHTRSHRSVIQGAGCVCVAHTIWTSRSAIVLENALCEGTYCFGQAIPAQCEHSGKERPALEASLSTGQHPRPHQVTPDVRLEPFPSCHRPRLSPAIDHMGTWKHRNAAPLSPKNNFSKMERVSCSFTAPKNSETHGSGVLI